VILSRRGTAVKCPIKGGKGGYYDFVSPYNYMRDFTGFDPSKKQFKRYRKLMEKEIGISVKLKKKIKKKVYEQHTTN
jgi:hypothetical protein